MLCKLMLFTYIVQCSLNENSIFMSFGDQLNFFLDKNEFDHFDVA